MNKENDNLSEEYDEMTHIVMEKLGITEEMKLDMLKASPIKLFEMTARSVMKALKTFDKLNKEGKMDKEEYNQVSAELSALMAYSLIILKNALAMQWFVVDEKTKQIITPIALNPMAKDKLPLLVTTMLQSASELVKAALITDPDYGKSSKSLDEMLEELKKMHNPFK